MFGRKKEPSIIALMGEELKTSKQNYLHHMEKLESHLAAVNMYAARIKRLQNAIKLESSDDIQTIVSSYLGEEPETIVSVVREFQARRDSMSNQGRSGSQQEHEANSQSACAKQASSGEVRGVGRGADSGGGIGPIGVQQNQQRRDVSGG